MATEEREIYSSGDVRITNLRAVLGPKTYAISNITSVSMSERRPSRVVPIALFGFGVIALIFFVGSIRLDPNRFGGQSANWADLVVAVILLVLAMLWANSQKTQYLVRVGSASGESDDLGSPDKAQIQQVVDALNEAIVQKG